MFDKNTLTGKISDVSFSLMICALVIVIPVLYSSSYALYQYSMIAVYAIILLGLNVLTGLSGQLSIGQGAFYALGAFTAAATLPHLGIHFYLVFPIVAIVGYLAGLAFGIIALRFKGPYLAIVTMSLAVGAPSLIKYFEGITGGSSGTNIKRPAVPSWLDVTSDQYIYVLAAILALIFFYATRNILKSQKGRALTAIRDNEIVAATMGISELRYKISAFAISVLYASVAGSLAALVIQFISPEIFTLEVSIFLIVGLIIGGVASKWGPIYGAFYLLYLPNVAEYFSKGAPLLVSGLVLILLVAFTPGGTNEIIMRTYYKIKKNFWF